jgi:hypothetical protein
MPFGIQFASFLVGFIKDVFSHGVRRPVVPRIIVFVVVEADCDDDASTYVGATPLFATAVKLQTDPEIFVFHKRGLSSTNGRVYQIAVSLRRNIITGPDLRSLDLTRT